MKKLQLLENHNSHYNNLLLAICESNYFKQEENLFLQWVIESKSSHSFLNGELIAINEASFKDWLKDKAEKAKEAIKSGAENAKDKATQFLAKVGEQISAYVKAIFQGIKDFLKKAWDYISKEVPSQMSKDKDKFVEKVKHSKIDKVSFAQEAKQLKDMAKGAVAWATGGVVDDMEKSAMTAASANESLTTPMIIALTECINEDKTLVKDIFESDSHDDKIKIPGLSKLMHKIGSLPPFSYLHSIENTVKQKTNSFLQKASIFLSEKGKVSGPYEFDVIGDVMKLYAGNIVKSGVHEIVHHISMTGIGALVAVALPGIGTLLNIMYLVAKALWIVGIVEATLNAVTA